nr:hypothetical protein [Tanacetum cinerariifolium]
MNQIELASTGDCDLLKLELIPKLKPTKTSQVVYEQLLELQNTSCNRSERLKVTIVRSESEFNDHIHDRLFKSDSLMIYIHIFASQINIEIPRRVEEEVGFKDISTYTRRKSFKKRLKGTTEFYDVEGNTNGYYVAVANAEKEVPPAANEVDAMKKHTGATYREKDKGVGGEGGQRWEEVGGGKKSAGRFMTGRSGDVDGRLKWRVLMTSEIEKEKVKGITCLIWEG